MDAGCGPYKTLHLNPVAVVGCFKKGLTCLLLPIFCFIAHAASGQSAPAAKAKKNNTVFYFSVGTHKSFYSKSNITLQSNASSSFDFGLHKAKAKDDRLLNFSDGAPQYSYTIGFYNRKKDWGPEFNFDHIKYYMRQYQRVQIAGTIQGKNYNMDTLLVPSFVQLEHSDGGNYATLNWVKLKSLATNKEGAEKLRLLLKVGGGLVVPKTNSTVMGKKRDDRYHVAGYVLAIAPGLRYYMTSHLFAEAVIKGAYANYQSFLIAGGTGSQQWWALHPTFLVGLQLGGALPK